MESIVFGAYSFTLLVIGFFIGIKYQMNLLLEMRDDGVINMEIKDETQNKTL